MIFVSEGMLAKGGSDIALTSPKVLYLWLGSGLEDWMELIVGWARRRPVRLQIGGCTRRAGGGER